MHPRHGEYLKLPPVRHHNALLRSPHADGEPSNAVTRSRRKYHYIRTVGHGAGYTNKPVRVNVYRSRLSAVMAALLLSLSPHRGHSRNVFEVLYIQFQKYKL